MMEDQKKILSHNAMVETYLFVNKTFWISIISMVALLCAVVMISNNEKDPIKLTALHASGIGCLVFLMVLSISRSTTALKVVTIIGSSFYAGLMVCILT
tara:strand:- start:3355 stop:3651 length:297 start_codon:yes stop_codon:yes gene_type:complete